jgi:hypothetical protein
MKFEEEKKMKVKDLNRNETIALLTINYKATVEELNFRARRVASAPDRESRKNWERRWKDTDLQLRGFENALKCMGIRVIRTFEDYSFYAQITNFEFIEF